uniref:Phosphodiesterase n=1 Tax=Syphacia muris TaxID=451379 RepID=A0A0N5AIG2_9BILA
MELREDAVISYLRTHPKFLEAYVTGSNVNRVTFQRWSAKRSLKRRSLRSVQCNDKWLSSDLSQQATDLINLSNDINKLLLELAEACAYVTSADSYDVQIVKDGQQLFLNAENTGIRLKKSSKYKRAPVYSENIYDISGAQFGIINFYSQIDDRDISCIRVICTFGSALLHFAQNFAQKLTLADRASLFLLDHKTNELYARIFDVGTNHEHEIKIGEDGNKEIRFPADKGIAGYVATTGKRLNIPDVYEDKRFNKEIDKKTGYKTRNILCMPIFIRGVVIGVVQMVNKSGGQFTERDENAFETFAVYCGLALHYAKLYDRIKRSEQKYRVALEVLAYHSVCSKDEASKLKAIKLKDYIEELDSFGFSPLKLTEVEKPLYAVYMFKTLFKNIIIFVLSVVNASATSSRYDEDDLIRFVLTVRKNYRRVAYHNWTHGWTVAQAMFALLRSCNYFTSLESLAMYTACLCHDLDHRGKNNAYMKSMSTPLAAIYSTSVMEHHHFNQTVTILQQEGHNILKSLSSNDYKQVLRLIKQCILATDLALFFPNRAKLKAIVDENKFDWKNENHRHAKNLNYLTVKLNTALVRAIVMTGCDLVAAAKPWSVQAETVKVIYGEFYDQGDAERLSGREPIPMMDRRRTHELPQAQVGFMEGICLPCYELLAKIIPESEIFYERTKQNTERWKEIAAEQKEKLTPTSGLT